MTAEAAPEAPPEAAEAAPEAPAADTAPPAEEAAPEASQEVAEAGAKPKAPPGKNRASKKIAELTKAKKEKERVNDDLRERLERAERELAALKGGNSNAETPDADLQSMMSGDVEPDPAKFEYGELDKNYIRAISRYEAKQAFAEERALRQHEAAQQQVAERRAKWDAQVEEAEEKYGDFVEKVIVGFENGTWQAPQHVGDLLGASEVGAEIVYYLASNPEESARVNNMTEKQQALWLGRMEARFSPPPPEQGSNGRTQFRASQADPPPTMIARGAGGKFSVNPSTTDFAAFEAMAMKELERGR